MAKIKLGELIEDIRGGVRNHVYSYYKGIHIVKTNPEYIGDPKTHTQCNRYRMFMSEITKKWQTVLSPAQRAGWDSFAVDPETGFNAFCRCNLLLRSISYPAPAYSELYDAPAGKTGPTIPVKTLVIYDSTEDEIVVYYKKPSEWGDERPGEPGPGRVRIWVKGPGAIYQRIDTTETGPETAEQTREMPNYREYETIQPWDPGIYLIWIDAVNSYGLKSAACSVNKVQVPQPGMPCVLGTWDNDQWNECVWG